MTAIQQMEKDLRKWNAEYLLGSMYSIDKQEQVLALIQTAMED